MNTEELAVRDALEERVSISGLVSIDEEVWAIYGSIPVDGQVIVAEFDDRTAAEYILRRVAAAEGGSGKTIGASVRPAQSLKQRSVARVVTGQQSGIPHHHGVTVAPLSSRRGARSSGRGFTSSLANTLRSWYSVVRD